MDLTSISYEQAILEIDISNKRIVELSRHLPCAIEELARLREELERHPIQNSFIGANSDRSNDFVRSESALDAARSTISVQKQAAEPKETLRTIDNAIEAVRPKLTWQLGARYIERLIARPMGAPVFHIDWICGKRHTAGKPVIVSKREHRLLSISGWAVPSNKKGPFDWVGIELRGRLGRIFKKVPVADRPDVATHFANPALVAAGFGVEFSLNELAAGSYAIDIIGGLGEQTNVRVVAGTIEID